MSIAHGCDDDLDELWYVGFDNGFEGAPPDLPDESYLEGYCDGVLEAEDFDD